MNKHIPTESDFLEDHSSLDAQCAWENFGGLSLDEAYEKFCENPLRYQEDFMFMGGKAFAYYFPVLERFVHQQLANDELGNYEEFSIIAGGIAMQVEHNRKLLGDQVLDRISTLTDAVLRKLKQLDWQQVECSNLQMPVIRSWEQAVAVLRGSSSA